MKLKLKHVMAVLTALALLFLYRGTFSQAEFYFQDHVMQRESPVDTQIVIVAVDDQSLEDLGTWPWSRSAHAQLVDTLSEGKPEVIAFDVTFATSSDEEADSEFVDAVARAGNVVLPVYGTFAESARLGAIEAEELSEPFEGLKEAAAATGHINTITDSDRVVRKALYSFNKEGVQIDSFTWEIYKLYMQRLGKQAETSKLSLDGFQRFPIAYTSSPNQYEAISYSAVLSGDVPADYFTNKIVLIGPYAVGFNDHYLTPMNDKQAMNGVEIHANILQQLMEQDFKRELDWKWNALVLLAAVVLAYYLFRKLNMLLSFLSVAVLIAVFIAGGRYLYGQGILLSLGYVVPLLAASCLAVVIFNYVSELAERRRVTDIFGRYVAPQVVNQILKNGEDGLKLGGSRRVLTVLFVDIRGFTPLSEKAEPEEIVEILNEYLDLTASCIFEQEGTLDKFIGDATMAIFNAPLLLDDHPMKAVRAAWAMKQGSMELEKKLIERFGFGVKFGIGIHTGPAVFGNIGSKTRMDYTAIGDTVNTAARLESHTKPGQIVLSESTYEAVKDRILAESLGEIKVKGKEQGIHIYELEGLK